MSSHVNQEDREQAHFLEKKYCLVALLSIQLALTVMFAVLEYANVFQIDDSLLGKGWTLGFYVIESLGQIVQLILILFEAHLSSYYVSMFFQFYIILSSALACKRSFWFIVPLVVSCLAWALTIWFNCTAYRLREERLHRDGTGQQEKQRAFLADIPLPGQAVVANPVSLQNIAPTNNNSLMQPSKETSIASSLIDNNNKEAVASQNV